MYIVYKTIINGKSSSGTVEGGLDEQTIKKLVKELGLKTRKSVSNKLVFIDKNYQDVLLYLHVNPDFVESDETC